MPSRSAQDPLRSTPSQAQLRQLTARVQAAREEERTSLARELHDELGQTLTAIKLELARVAALFREQQAGVKVIDRLQSLVGLTEIAIATVKRLATDLRPPTLDLGLAAAIRWEATTLRARTGLTCRVIAKQENTGLSPAQETVLFRVVQEALTNVVRHANASAIDIVLSRWSRTGFLLEIRDSGRGISAAQASDPRSIGLLGMRERVALIGGQLAISGSPGKGTVVSVRVPIKPISNIHRRERRGRRG